LRGAHVDEKGACGRNLSLGDRGGLKRQSDASSPLPREQIRIGIDAVEPTGVDLEVEVGRSGDRLTAVAHETDHLTGAHPGAAEDARGVGGQVGVVELVSAVIGEPQPVSSERVDTHLGQHPARHGDQGRAGGSEDVIAVVPPGHRTRSAVVVDVAEGAHHREDIVGATRQIDDAWCWSPWEAHRGRGPLRLDG